MIVLHPLLYIAQSYNIFVKHMQFVPFFCSDSRIMRVRLNAKKGAPRLVHLFLYMEKDYAN